MRFPRKERVTYERTSLVEVICQVRFPAVLRVDTEVPVVVQDRIRDAFPGYEKQLIADLPPLPLNIPTGLTSVPLARAEHTFFGDVGDDKVTLGREFVAYTTHRYSTWEAFMERVTRVTAAASDAYALATTSRVGLRYQNLLRRSALGLGDTAWSALVSPALLGLVAATEYDLDRSLGEVSFGLDLEVGTDVGASAGRGRIFHGLIPHDGELCYLIDTDLYVDRPLPWDAVVPVLDDLHLQSWCCFRSLIQDALHNVMGPKPKGASV